MTAKRVPGTESFINRISYSPEYWARIELAKREGRRIADSESWTPPDPGLWLAEARNDPPAPVRHVVEGRGRPIAMEYGQ
jgi:hypothetical protein